MEMFTYFSDENTLFDEQHSMDVVISKIKELVKENYSDEDIIEYILSYDNIEENQVWLVSYIKRILQKRNTL